MEKKNIFYCRVSTEEQSLHGCSMQAQEQRIRQYCDLYNMNIDEVVVDAGISAKNLNRPGIQSILAAVKRREVAAVIVYKLDRLTRSVRDLAEIVDLFNKCGVSLVSVNERIDTGSAAGRMLLNMLGVIAQWERETIGERTATALQFKKQNGRRYNHDALFGYEHLDAHLVPCEKEQVIIALVMQEHGQGRSYLSIAEALNAQGIGTRNGGRWYAQQVKRIIDNAEARCRMQLVNKAALHLVRGVTECEYKYYALFVCRVYSCDDVHYLKLLRLESTPHSCACFLAQ
ncbi:MAG: recombinase family protein [Chitinivibrionales bacterium]|nr:recombinase family protein [Chitinivibrionales bacterium]